LLEQSNRKLFFGLGRRKRRIVKIEEERGEGPPSQPQKLITENS
jgi:hypothetical protein